jgi:hypothetical protein
MTTMLASKQCTMNYFFARWIENNNNIVIISHYRMYEELCMCVLNQFLNWLEYVIKKLAKIEEELQQACQEHEHEKVLITMVTFLIFLCHVAIPYLKKLAFQQ